MIADLKAEIVFVSEGAELTDEDDILPGAPMDDVNTQAGSVRISVRDDASLHCGSSFGYRN